MTNRDYRNPVDNDIDPTCQLLRGNSLNKFKDLSLPRSFEFQQSTKKKLLFQFLGESNVKNMRRSRDLNRMIKNQIVRDVKVTSRQVVQSNKVSFLQHSKMLNDSSDSGSAFDNSALNGISIIKQQQIFDTTLPKIESLSSMYENMLEANFQKQMVNIQNQSKIFKVRTDLFKDKKERIFDKTFDYINHLCDETRRKD